MCVYVCENQNGGREQTNVWKVSPKLALYNRKRTNSRVQFRIDTRTKLGPVFSEDC